MSTKEVPESSEHTVVTTQVASRSTGEQARKSCLLVIYGNDLGKRVALEEQSAVVGRSSKSGVTIDDDSISRQHCELLWDGRGYKVSDLGSTNGTYVNDEPASDRELRHGDQIKVGRTIMKFISGDNIEGRYHDEIYRLMTVDGLTQVFNKRHFDEVLEREASRSSRYGSDFCLILFDIDHFKQVNDTHGHLAGDAVLHQIGQLMSRRVRRDDLPCRTGGEEFAVLTPETRLEGAVDLAEKLRALVDETAFVFDGKTIPLTISLGVATWTPEMELGEELVKAADAKLYEAKHAGRNRVRH